VNGNTTSASRRQVAVVGLIDDRAVVGVDQQRVTGPERHQVLIDETRVHRALGNEQERRSDEHDGGGEAMDAQGD
jgi:hypothetical protein